MKALSIKQPWAYLIVSGMKDIENRDWKPSPEMIGQRIIIHASLTLSRLDFEQANSIIEPLLGKARVHKLYYNNLQMAENRTGVAIGTAIIDSIVTEHESPWFFGEYGWVLKDAKFLPDPIPFKGKLGLWEFPDELIPGGSL